MIAARQKLTLKMKISLIRAVALTCGLHCSNILQLKWYIYQNHNFIKINFDNRVHLTDSSKDGACKT